MYTYYSQLNVIYDGAKQYQLYHPLDLSHIDRFTNEVINEYANKILLKVTDDNIEIRRITGTSNIINSGSLGAYHLYVTINKRTILFPDDIRKINTQNIDDKELAAVISLLQEQLEPDKLVQMINNNLSDVANVNFVEMRENMQEFKRKMEVLNLLLSDLLANKDSTAIINQITNDTSIPDWKKEKIIEALQLNKVYSRLSIENLTNDDISLEDLADSYGYYTNTPAGSMRNLLNDIERDQTIMKYKRYHMIRPKFKVFFREDDNESLLMLSDIYGYDDEAIVSIEISADVTAASKTARLVLSNVMNNLTDPDVPLYEDVVKSDITKTNGAVIDSEQQLASLNIKPGTTIIIVGGYENYSYDNPVFVGKIVDMYPGPQLTITAQSFGAELLQVPYQTTTKLKSLDNLGDLGDIANDVLTKIGADHFGSSGLSGFADKVSDPFDLRNTNFMLKSYLAFETPYILDNNRDLNVYLTKTHHLTTKYVKGYRRRWYITPDETTWDVLNELSLYRKDYVVRTRPFNTDNYQTLRETVYVGPKNGAYVYSDTDGFKYNMIKDMMFPKEMNLSILNSAKFYSNTDHRHGIGKFIDKLLGEIPIKIGRFFTGEYHMFYKHHDAFGPEVEKEIARDVIFKDTIVGSMANYKYNEIITPNIDDDPAKIEESIKTTTKTIMNNMAVSSIRKTHFFSSHSNIIANNIQVNNLFYNKVILQFPQSLPNPDASNAAKNGLLSKIKNTLWGSGGGIASQAFDIDDNIRPSEVREYITYQKNIDTDVTEIGTGKIKWALKREIDTFVDSSEAQNSEYIYTELSNIASTIKNKTGFNKGTNFLMHNPFTVIPSKDLTDAEISKKVSDGFVKVGDMLLKGDARIETESGKIYNVSEYVTHLEKVTNGALTPEQIKNLLLASYGSYPQWYTVGKNILAKQGKAMYSGTLTVIGDFNINEGDRCVLYDVINGMYGMFDIKGVVHSYSAQSGFITTITPELITYVTDRRDIFDSTYLIDRARKRATDGLLAGFVAAGTVAGTIAGVVTGTSGNPLAGLVLGAVSFGISALTAQLTIRHQLNLILIKEASEVIGRHAIGFIPLIRHGQPFVGGIGGFGRTSWKSVIANRDDISSGLTSINAIINNSLNPGKETTDFKELSYERKK